MEFLTGLRWLNSTAILRRFCLLVIVGTSSGCSHFHNLNSIERFRHGYTIVLPGIEGASFANSNIAQGLKDGGVETAIEVHDWTTENPLLFAVHLRNLDRNRRQARRLAEKIVTYQDRYPGRPVHLVGHSGGAGMAILTLEALPSDRTITTAILLAGALAPDHDLSQSLAKTEKGIWNYYSPIDAALLGAGTLVMGTIDGEHAVASGAIGFNIPKDLPLQDRAVYQAKLHQVPYDIGMVTSGNLGGHFGPTWQHFVSDYLAPILQSPVPRTSTSADPGPVSNFADSAGSDRL